MPNYWIFQTNPRNYDLPSALERLDYDRWTIPDQYSRKEQKGDKVFFWKAGGKEGNAGIYAFGEVMSQPGHLPELPAAQPFVRSRRYLESTPLKADVKYERKLHNSPILADGLKEHSVLKKLSVLAVRQGTVFPVRDKEIHDLYELVGL